MAHEVIASIRVPLPDDPKEMAGALGEIATAWAEFLAPLSVTVEATFSVNETRTKPGPRVGSKRQPRIATVPAEAA